mmetsp:Transcript_33198/g.103455  ORF Transcript_33198/g.103455 Transcript_33198/m.103455 type:complete len:200 (-) Transcript_33198:84-683(-)
MPGTSNPQAFRRPCRRQQPLWVGVPHSCGSSCSSQTAGPRTQGTSNPLACRHAHLHRHRLPRPSSWQPWSQPCRQVAECCIGGRRRSSHTAGPRTRGISSLLASSCPPRKRRPRRPRPKPHRRRPRPRSPPRLPLWLLPPTPPGRPARRLGPRSRGPRPRRRLPPAPRGPAAPSPRPRAPRGVLQQRPGVAPPPGVPMS